MEEGPALLASIKCQALKQALDREVLIWKRTLRLREVNVLPKIQ